MNPARILAAYRLIFVALILVASAQTLAAGGVHASHAALLALAEIAGALALGWRRTQWIGASLLLVVFACAQVLSALEGGYPTRFLQYAASTIFIVTLDRALSRQQRPTE